MRAIKMGRPTGLEPSRRFEGKSLENADLVEGLFLGTGNKKQEGVGRGREKRGVGQPPDNLRSRLRGLA